MVDFFSAILEAGGEQVERESPKKSYWGQVGKSFTERGGDRDIEFKKSKEKLLGSGRGQKLKKKVTVVRYKKIKETSNLIIDLPKLVSDGGV